MNKFLMTAALMLFVIWLAVGCAAVDTSGSQVIAGGDYVLKSGESVNGNLLVLGGNSTLQKDSHVNGNMNVIGGNTDANGEIKGNIWLLGGNVDLGPNALVHGNVTVNGGNVDRAPGAQVMGTFNSGVVFEGPMLAPVLTITPAMIFGWLLGRSVLLAALAAVIVLLAPDHIKRTTDAIVRQSFGAGLVGLVAMVLAPILLVLFAVTIIGIPLTIIGAVVLLVAMLFGWTAVGTEVGKRLAVAFKWNWSPVLHALVGTFLLAVLLSAFELIPIIGWLASVVVSMFALGGVVLTRFGRHEYLPPSNVTPPPVPQSSPL